MVNVPNQTKQIVINLFCFQEIKHSLIKKNGISLLHSLISVIFMSFKIKGISPLMIAILIKMHIYIYIYIYI